mgnify:CR=1 FL=1
MPSAAEMLTTSTAKSWQDYANCLGVDPDLFFPERGASTREAKEVCRGCVVRDDCCNARHSCVSGVCRY